MVGMTSAVAYTVNEDLRDDAILIKYDIYTGPYVLFVNRMDSSWSVFLSVFDNMLFY